MVELTWSTFLLELLNFLILIWILKRFLYKPVLDVIARRRAAIDQSMADAEAKRTEAKALESQYQNRLSEWNVEKQQLQQQLSAELASQRQQAAANLEKELDQQRQKEQVLQQRRLADAQLQAQMEAREQGARFTARLFQRVASPAVEAQLIEAALEDLGELNDAGLKRIRDSSSGASGPPEVVTAFPLSDAQRAAISQVLARLTQRPADPTFRVDPGLIAGMRISLGPWSLQANLLDELAFFSEKTREQPAVAAAVNQDRGA